MGGGCNVIRGREEGRKGGEGYKRSGEKGRTRRGREMAKKRRRRKRRYTGKEEDRGVEGRGGKE